MPPAPLVHWLPAAAGTPLAAAGTPLAAAGTPSIFFFLADYHLSKRGGVLGLQGLSSLFISYCPCHVPMDT